MDESSKTLQVLKRGGSETIALTVASRDAIYTQLTPGKPTRRGSAWPGPFTSAHRRRR
jgi:hypothetical protein